MRFLLMLFIIVPIAEMWVLIEVGTQIGALNTIFLVFLTAVIGLALLRQQGLSTLMRVNQRMEAGELPATEILEGVFLAVGGALLLTPGFITDAIGFCCLIGPLRRGMIGYFVRQDWMTMRGQGRQGQSAFYFSSISSGQQRPRAHEPKQEQSDIKHDSTTIEGDFRREE
jgi:UPF0716 protein FxsA